MTIDQHQSGVDRETAQRHAGGAGGKAIAERVRDRATVVGRNRTHHIRKGREATAIDLLTRDHRDR